MPDYRVYCFDGKNQIVSGEWINAADDAEAIGIVQARRLPIKCEVWNSRRMVAQVPAHEAA